MELVTRAPPRGSRKRSVLKVVVLGQDPALQAGFLSMASGSHMSNQLYPVLGICIGVVSSKLADRHVVLQLWSLPREDRLEGLVSAFMRGHHAAIVLLRSEERFHAAQLLEMVSPSALGRTMVVVLGPPSEAQALRDELVPESSEPVYSASSVIDAVLFLARRVSSQKSGEAPVFVALNEAACPPLDAVPERGNYQFSTPEELEELRSFCRSLDVPVERDVAIMKTRQGRVRVNLRSGRVRFTPVICEHCENSCVRDVGICIVSVDSGWTNSSLRPSALLIMSKIHAFATDRVPPEVMAQIHRALTCRKWQPPEDTPLEVFDIAAAVRSRSQERVPLIEEARRRLQEGRLTQRAFDILKRRLRTAQRR